MVRSLLQWYESSYRRKAPNVSITGRWIVSAAELQIPVFVHVITRQSMLLVLRVVKMCQCPATSLVLYNCASLGDWRSWNGFMERSCRMAAFLGRAERPQSSSLLYSALNMKLLRSPGGALWNSIWKGGVSGGWYSGALLLGVNYWRRWKCICLSVWPHWE